MDAGKRTLSEIGHLFLSDVRDRHMGGAVPPLRMPPEKRGSTEPVAEGAQAMPANPDDRSRPTANPFAQGAARVSASAAAKREPLLQPPVTAIIGAHLSGGQANSVTRYARHLADRIGRVGLIEVGDSEVRLRSYELEANADDAAAEQDHDEGDSAAISHAFDSRSFSEALEEMNCDVRRWLLHVENPRSAEGRGLLREIGHWVLLSACDHEGVVNSYRMLKSVSDVPQGRRPRLTLALLDAESEAELVRVYRKLSGVCDQFLGWTLEPEPALHDTPAASEHTVFWSSAEQPGTEAVHASAAAGASHWLVLSQFMARARLAKAARADADLIPTPHSGGQAKRIPIDSFGPAASAKIDVTDRPVSTRAVGPSPYHDDDSAAFPSERTLVDEAVSPTAAQQPKPVELRAAPARLPDPEILDLVGTSDSSDSILASVISQKDGGLIECPVRAPMCSSVRLAVGRDRQVILLAVAREGLAELRSIGQAYRWLIENRALIAMAVPQFAIDPLASPRLRLLVDQSDVSAEALRPMLESGHVTVQAYRKVRWGGRTGLLLEAA